MKLILRIFGVLTLFALLTTAAIPQGWMPAQGEDGKVLLVICTTDGIEEQWIDIDPDEPIHDDHDTRAMCPFAGLTADKTVPTISVPVLTDYRFLPRWSHKEFTHRSAGFYARYDARGPPQIS